MISIAHNRQELDQFSADDVVAMLGGISSCSAANPLAT